MPISFSSKSHGRIPIGFFNIETDMLLMDRYFFFSTDFCEWIIEWADAEDFNCDEKMVYAIQQREMIGNLSGAIYGYEFTGFIGRSTSYFLFRRTAQVSNKNLTALKIDKQWRRQYSLSRYN